MIKFLYIIFAFILVLGGDPAESSTVTTLTQTSPRCTSHLTSSDSKYPPLFSSQIHICFKHGQSAEPNGRQKSVSTHYILLSSGLRLCTGRVNIVVALLRERHFRVLGVLPCQYSPLFIYTQVALRAAEGKYCQICSRRLSRIS